MQKTIGLFINHPECSKECCDGMIKSFGQDYKIKMFSANECNSETFSSFDLLAFPGGIGDANSYDRFFRRKSQKAVVDYIEQGGKYLGICMGAYWAGSYYFDILDDVDAVQYIKRPGCDIKRSYSTIAKVVWNGREEHMFFYDGCAFVGNENKFKTIARYTNGDPMAIIQGKIGLIGCHPESQKFWYESPRQYINRFWHQGKHNSLLQAFTKQLMEL